MWTPVDDYFVVLMEFWKAPSKKNSLRGLGGVFVGFGSLPGLLFLVVGELSVGSNPGCTLGFGHVIIL